MTVLDIKPYNPDTLQPMERRAGDGRDVGPSNDWKTGVLVGWVVVAASLLLLIP